MARRAPPPATWQRYASSFVPAAAAKGYTADEIAQFLQCAEALFGNRVPVIFDSHHFALHVGYTVQFLYAAANAPERFYRRFSIPKPSGGERTIHEPLTDLKVVQRWILDNILTRIEIAATAKAYRKGYSVRDAARFHRARPCVLRVDLKDFFPSIKRPDIHRVFRNVGYSPNVCGLLAALTTLAEGLPQGAPTSPALSNIVFSAHDTEIFNYARKNQLYYTRYADDLVFSGEMVPGAIVGFLGDIFKRTEFSINHSKTRVMRKGTRQIVNGIVVNSGLRAPRDTRRWIRQQVYYLATKGIEAHLAFTNITNSHYLEHLLGKISFCLLCNPQDQEMQVAKNAVLGIRRNLEGMAHDG